MTRITPRRFTILQCSHIFLTDALTFMLKSFSFRLKCAPRSSRKASIAILPHRRLLSSRQNSFCHDRLKPPSTGVHWTIRLETCRSATPQSRDLRHGRLLHACQNLRLTVGDKVGSLK